MREEMGLFRKDKVKKPEQERNLIPKTQAPSAGESFGKVFSYHTGNLQGVGARERQEDAFCIVNAFDMVKIREEGLFFTVCDGMGGMKDGRLASETATASLRNAFIRMNKKEDLVLALQKAVLQASGEVEALLKGNGGSTVAGGIIYRDRLYYVSVGDSRLYLKRGQRLYRLNREHNVRNEIFLDCIRKGDIRPEEGRNHPEGAALTGFLGMRGLQEMDAFVRPLPMKGEDVLMACSDGVCGVLSEAEICRALEGDDPALMCQRLEAEIIGHFDPCQDNYTAVVVKCFG